VVPVSRPAILDDTYVAADKATLHNEPSGDDELGVVTLSARRARGESQDTPLLHASVQTSSGGSIDCRMVRPVSWSASNQAVTLDLRCERKLDLGAVTRVTLPD
jgi:hypothetical protein